MADKNEWWKPEAPWPKREPGGKTVVVTGAKLIDGNGGPVLDNPVIVLKGERIHAVGAKGKVQTPPDAEIIDMAGCTLMPGMTDCHIHTAMFNCMTFHNHRVAQWEVTPQLQQMYALFHAQNCFEMGFTTLRDLGMNSSRGLFTQELCGVRDSINAGIVEGPRMLIGGFTTITGSHLDLIQPRAMPRHGFNTGDGPHELRKLARLNLLWGCDVIKTCASGGGGTDTGPNPVELVLAALGTCQEITYRLYADALGIPLRGVSVKVEGDLDPRGFFAVDGGQTRPGYRGVRATVVLDSPAPEAELKRLRETVDRHCPVLDIIRNPVPVETKLARGAVA